VTGRRAIYRDSALVAEDISPAHFQAPSQAFAIGKGLNLEYFEGALDEVRIYNDALALEEIQALYNWQSAIFATWNYSLPKGLEGPYHVDLRSVDRFSHTHTIPNVWTGEIDTLAPRASLTYNDLGDNTIQVQCTAQDYNLAKDGFVCPTGNSQLGRENQSAGWYTAIFSQTKLYRLSTPLQTVQGASNSMTACDLSGNCTMLTAAQNRPLRLAPTAVGLSLILTPTTHTVLTSTDPISIAGYALAQNYLQDLNLTVNASTVYTETYPSSTLTETVWETSWTPPAQGAFVLQATITDSLGTAITDTADNILYVDTTPPLISLTTTLITEQNFDQHGYISLSGLVTEAVGLQRLQAQVETVYTISLPSDAWQDIVLPSGAAWKGAVHSGSPKPPDGQLITLTLRAIDVAGQAATISRTILADAAPPAPVTVTLAYTN
ncbi:MAG: LamG domain-containing protein, partial [Chloroflexi bacterium]|nr:LamG domain-containing protein [Chloroflexota bacterium]